MHRLAMRIDLCGVALRTASGVRTAVSADYSDRLREFLEARESYLHQIAA